MKIVAFGGGTGLSTLLRGLKKFEKVEITAVVTVMDDGGSSGIMREEFGILPPGDIRNNIVALAQDESLMAQIMAYRFQEGTRFKDQSLGNLIIAALTKINGSFPAAIENISSILAIKGKVLPVTEESVQLVAHMSDGSVITGESNITKRNGKINEIGLNKPAKPFPKVIEEISKSDVVIIGPGSLFTSIIPNLLVDSIPEILKEKPKILIANLMTQPGETTGMDAEDHLKIVEKYLKSEVDKVIVNSQSIPKDVLERYEKEGSKQVLCKIENPKFVRFPMVKIVTDKIDGQRKIRHDPDKLAKAVIKTIELITGDKVGI
ncbi:gluconeogenesis factor YvcK family protein [Athalassotoga saccharophila]|uniref:gluconeogenesis factor YvcK family protein n=1 Tax=Athalassotoga saccharophila TaxID=1441386 RepID=UPI00137951F9|nr:uridine diphosphate-N-acetylglucosamine-binding protein YvcK [Athalassotoga saccharophila]BBJ28137.1 gluconeogenesis factor [Athalassotoga saccharophila]